MRDQAYDPLDHNNDPQSQLTHLVFQHSLLGIPTAPLALLNR
jgi:hypothetical protein